eukprot:359523-Chlamydomonas_euryale.AAC.4
MAFTASGPYHCYTSAGLLKNFLILVACSCKAAKPDLMQSHYPKGTVRAQSPQWRKLPSCLIQRSSKCVMTTVLA